MVSAACRAFASLIVARQSTPTTAQVCKALHVNMKKHILIYILAVIPLQCVCAEWIAIGTKSKGVVVNTIEIEKALWLFLASIDDIKFEPKETYRFQYKMINEESIFINALCGPVERSQDVGAFPQPTAEELSQAIYQVFDGGSCYFQLHYNVKNKAFSGLSINGRA